MLRDEYLRRLVDAAYVDIYLSATDGARIYWPWRMQPAHEAGKSHRNACEKYIVDSSFNRPDIGNAEVLDTAERFDAEAVVLADVWQDMGATVDALLEGLELYDDHAFDGDVILPLQAPHDECYRELEGHGDIYAIGGVKDKPDARKVAATRSVRDVAGDSITLHGLGFGVSDTLVRAVQSDPDLLDSIDYSTPVQSSMDGSIDAGKERMSVVAARSGAWLVEDLRRLSPYIENQGGSEQTGLESVFQ